MPPYLVILLCTLIGTLASAQAPAMPINDHQAVIKAVVSSRQPLTTWQTILKRHADDPQGLEQAADAVLGRLQDMPAQDIFVPLLKHWQQHQPVVTRTSDDHGHEVGVYLIAARASGELNRLLSEQTERYVYAIAAHQPDNLFSELADLYQQSHPAITAGIKAALAHLTPQQRQVIINQHMHIAEVKAISPLLALELNSPALQNMIVASQQATAIQALLNAWQQTPPTDTSLLQTLVQQSGPHQLQALGIFYQLKLTEQNSMWLIALLNDDTLGRTAARILGRQSTTKTVDDLVQRWQQSTTEPLKTNLLYALSRNAIGLKKLKIMMQQKSLNLSKNQQQWLQQQWRVNDVQ